jgi:hypothetical protein
MIAALAIAALGVVVALTGVITMLASAMPSFGGRPKHPEWTLLLGLVMLVIGLGFMFYAGTWL